MNQRLRRSPPDVVYTPIDVTSYTSVLEGWHGLAPFKEETMLTKKYAQNKVRIWLAAVIVLGSATLAITQLVYADSDDSMKAPISDIRPKVDTPLGEEKFLLMSMSGSEQISRLFYYQLEMLSEDPDVDPNLMLGERVTVSVELPDGGERNFDGVVSNFARGELLPDISMTIYRAELVPWLWFLTQTADLRIFHDQSVPEIIEMVFTDLGFNDFMLEVDETYSKREYVVQYRETDFNFVSRLMEQEGIFYFFEHIDGQHTLVLSDSATAYRSLPGETPFMNSGAEPAPGSITTWERQFEFRPGKWSLTDYNFIKPSTSLSTSATSTVDPPGREKFEIYDYPGGYTDVARGNRLAQIRIQEENSQSDTVSGASSELRFTPGHVFTLSGHLDAEPEGQYLITSVFHRLEADVTEIEEDDLPEDLSYENDFTAIPSSLPFRPPRLTHKPFVHGPQTAVVIGPAGEDIHTDEFGRVKVRFHWDREGKCDEKSSCWIRVAHSWSSQGHGAFFLPRIGQEVLVDFLEGDPDRPVVTGLVYNGEQMPPFNQSHQFTTDDDDDDD